MLDDDRLPLCGEPLMIRHWFVNPVMVQLWASIGTLCVVADSARVVAEAKLPGDEYYRQLGQARARQQARDYETAALIYQQLVDTCRDDGDVWLQLGHCQAAAGRSREAIASYQEALDRGASEPDVIARRIAAAYARLGDKEAAYQWLEKTITAGLPDRIALRREAALAPLADEEHFRELAAFPPRQGLSRDDAWRYDLQFLVSEARRLHPELYRRTTSDSLDNAAKSLAGRVSKLSDAEVAVEFQRIAAAFGDGHSMAPLGSKQVPLNRIPLRFYWFADGVFVVDADESARQWIGFEVVRVGDLPVDEALEAVSPLVSRDNDMGLRAWAPRLLSMPTVLKVLGIAHDDDVALVLRDRDGDEQEVRIAAAPPGARGLPLPPASEANQPVPRWLRDPDANFWQEYLDEHATLYIQFNHVAESRRHTFAQFADEVQAACDQKPVRAIVIDLRHNGGGNTFLYQPLLRALIYCERADKDRKLFALTSRFTFSACQNFSADLDRLTETIFAGEPTGSSPNSIGESTDVILPCSNIRVSISTQRWQFSYPMDRRVWIAPEIPVALTSRDYFAGRDPVLDAVLSVIAADQREPPPAR
ncbi:MAG: hypothetical protein K2Y37_06595 [Pirellulales bacterium]|nr:hypothetical protein [Pirellulales bacterium]